MGGQDQKGVWGEDGEIARQTEKQGKPDNKYFISISPFFCLTNSAVKLTEPPREFQHFIPSIDIQYNLSSTPDPLTVLDTTAQLLFQTVSTLFQTNNVCVSVCAGNQQKINKSLIN